MPQSPQHPSTERSSWWSEETVAVVTGANKGIGLQLVREFSKRGITTVLTSRNEERGKEAVRKLAAEEGLSNIAYHQLDVRSQKSVDRLISWLREEYESVDILVNNAGICSAPGCSTLDCSDRVEAVRSVIETNFYGVKRMIEAIVPIMKFGSRIVNVSSKCGDLNYLKNGWRERLEDIANLTQDAIDECLNEFLNAVEEKQIEAKGWPVVSEAALSGNVENTSDYSISKIALNAYSRIKASELQKSGRGSKLISVNCVCPGMTSTSMAMYHGHSVEMGADTAVWIALFDDDEAESKMPTGQFFTGRTNVGFSGMPIFFNGKLMDFKEAKQQLVSNKN